MRTDPLLKLVCGRLPETGADLASQPTLSRLENAVDRKSCYRLAMAVGELYMRERERDGVPTHIVLDLDGTDDPTHGAQEGSAYHGYYRQHMYHPLLVFDGETHQLVAAVLRPGNTHGSTGVVAVLKRVVRALRARWPDVTIEVRMDSGGSRTGDLRLVRAGRPAVHHRPDQQPPPHRPRRALSLAEAQRHGRKRGAEKGRLLGETVYQAVELGAAAAGRHQGRSPPQRSEHPLRRHHPSRSPRAPSMTGTSIAATVRTRSRIQARLLRRPAQRPPLLGQPVPVDLARRGLLAARYRAPLAGREGGLSGCSWIRCVWRLLKIGGRVYQLPGSGPVALGLLVIPGNPSGDHLATHHRLRE